MKVHVPQTLKQLSLKSYQFKNRKIKNLNLKNVVIFHSGCGRPDKKDETRVFGESRTVADEHGAIHGANFSYNP